jgi:hypothetical protein
LEEPVAEADTGEDDLFAVFIDGAAAVDREKTFDAGAGDERIHGGG